MLRENLVGVVVEATDDPVLLVEYLGEGVEGVVYAFSPMTDLTQQDRAVKLPRGLAMFEMDTLHHGLRVHHDLYPNHPLLMNPEQRLAMLTEEMLSRIDNGHALFRVALYRRILDDVLVVLEQQCAGVFRRGAPLGPELDASPSREWLDDNLARRLGDLLADDLIVPQHRAFFEAVLAEVESGIARWQAAGSYAPLSRNPFFNLLGLHAEDFIDYDELVHISRSPAFVARLVPQHLHGLFDLIATLYFHLKGRLGDGKRVMVENKRSGVQLAVAACELLAHAASVCIGYRHLVGLASLWQARLLLLDDAPIDSVEPLALAALDALREPTALRDRHDALVLLAGLYQHTDPQRMVDLLNEALRIRASLPGD